jgi:hypothetical protein
MLVSHALSYGLCLIFMSYLRSTAAADRAGHSNHARPVPPSVKRPIPRRQWSVRGFGVVYVPRSAYGVTLLELSGFALRVNIFQLCGFESHRRHHLLDM